MNLFIEQNKGKKVAINCTTQELANKIDRLIVEAGGRSLAYHWKEYGTDFCFNLEDLGSYNGNTYCKSQFFKDRNFTIISAEEVLEHKQINSLINNNYSIF